jgi:NAD+ kinase
MDAIKTVGIISKPGAERGRALVPQLLRWLAARDISTRYDRATAEYVNRSDGLPRGDVPEGCQFVIVLGGDGTLLSAAAAIASRQIPLLAVNLGSLGFLTAITAEEVFPELERALSGEHRIGHRRMMRCLLVRDEKEVGSYLALNDVVVSKGPMSHMIDLETHVDNHYVCTYKADGLIVATPTGSTAYSLSAGGPIVFPTVAAFAITPICPHMLTNRPVIVPDGAVIQIYNRAEDDVGILTVDGQEHEPMKKGDRLVCRASSHTLELIRPPRLLYFDVLRQKLKWGER